MGRYSKRIGITGGIGAGKSTVTDYLREKGYAVIDADEIAREAAAPGQPAMLRLREAVGDEVFLPDGNLDRSALAKLVFYDPVGMMTVNGIFHGDIKERVERACREREEMAPLSRNPRKPVFLSIPLLFESNADWKTGKNWLVTADDDLRIKRVMERDALSEADVRARMDSQMPEAEKRKLADVVIENNGSVDELYAKLENLLSDRT